MPTVKNAVDDATPTWGGGNAHQCISITTAGTRCKRPAHGTDKYCDHGQSLHRQSEQNETIRLLRPLITRAIRESESSGDYSSIMAIIFGLLVPHISRPSVLHNNLETINENLNRSRGRNNDTDDGSVRDIFSSLDSSRSRSRTRAQAR